MPPGFVAAPCSVVSAGSSFEGEGASLGLLAALVGLDATSSSGGTGPVYATSSACTSAASSSSGILVTPSSGTGSPDLLQCHCNMRRHSLVLVPQGYRRLECEAKSVGYLRWKHDKVDLTILPPRIQEQKPA
ncbi:hypothetical protein PIB30_018131 [Stylosanthes scabra]|uniref:Uncharacterized protein n=1 Tax=Stylosanthes scabra TaxID=79078 RepID=A0ABU6Q7R0_9FABA|nr:hypothetical protein [Stylosanthes scabra]